LRIRDGSLTLTGSYGALMITTISFPDDKREVLDNADKLWKLKGFNSRSEYIMFLLEEDFKKSETEIFSVGKPPIKHGRRRE
jgi:hypothetical protein